MYTLYYSPGSCSLVVHVLLEELGVPFEAKRVDLAAKEHHGPEYRKLNPKGKVPALATPEGLLTECVAIVQYLCDKHDAQGKWLAAPGTWRRAKTLERIATLATEVHPLFNRFFHADDFSDAKDVQDAVKARGTEKLLAYFSGQDAALTGLQWSGDVLTVADIHFMVMARWGRRLDPSAIRMKNIGPWFTRMTERPAVKRAMEREGITPFGT
ncbi:MAG TPA: glutathione S-transferase N-terminal domain-containing protein [Usitatibacter sp.]